MGSLLLGSIGNTQIGVSVHATTDAASPVLSGVYQVSKKLVFAALSVVVLMFGPAIRERINPVLAPVTERVPDMHSRGELVGVVLEFLQLDHAIAFLASLFS